MFRNRKGIAPLIATVILVAFAVALGALVIDWNRGYVEEVSQSSKELSSTQLSCQFELGLALTDVKGEQQICFNNESNYIELSLENNKKYLIENVTARVTTNESIFGPLPINSTANADELIGSIEGGEAKRGFIDGDLYNGTIEEVMIFPGLRVEDKITYCFDSAVIVEGPLNECD